MVNGYFGQFFFELFGGGWVELVMIGEEIFDVGVQVIVQLLGKKNLIIYLFFGGEKVLMVIVLVFLMFQLNLVLFCLFDEVDVLFDDINIECFCGMVKKMFVNMQFLFIFYNKIVMEMVEQLVGVIMQEFGVLWVVEVDIEEVLKMRDVV